MKLTLYGAPTSWLERIVVDKNKPYSPRDVQMDLDGNILVEFKDACCAFYCLFQIERGVYVGTFVPGSDTDVECSLEKLLVLKTNVTPNEFCVLQYLSSVVDQKISAPVRAIYPQHGVLMDFSPGEDLFTHIQNSTMTENTLYCVTVMLEVVSVLREFYTTFPGCLHGDLKPENFMVLNPAEETPRLWLLDFGHTCLEGTEVTRMFGTHNYNGPELKVETTVTVSRKTDMHQLGVTFFVMAHGFLPIYQDSAIKLDLLNLKLEPIIKDMMHPEPSDRPSLDQVHIMLTDLLMILKQ
jgi:serine/threonine protein kinase